MKLSVGPGFSQLTGWTEQPLKVSLLPFVTTFPTACFCHWCNCGSMNSSVAPSGWMEFSLVVVVLLYGHIDFHLSQNDLLNVKIQISLLELVPNKYVFMHVHTHTHTRIYVFLNDMKKWVHISFSYPWCTPVELGKDAAPQGIYSLQHFRSELWKLRGLTDRWGNIIAIQKKKNKNKSEFIFLNQQTANG